jgi:hypothetical protein
MNRILVFRNEGDEARYGTMIILLYSWRYTGTYWSSFVIGKKLGSVINLSCFQQRGNYELSELGFRVFTGPGKGWQPSSADPIEKGEGLRLPCRWKVSRVRVSNVQLKRVSNV